jgi:hypothetical protein
MLSTMTKAELLYHTKKFLEVALANGETPTNKTYLSKRFSLELNHVNQIFSFAEQNDIFTSYCEQVSFKMKQTYIVKKRDLNMKELLLVSLFEKFKQVTNEEEARTLVSDFIGVLSDRDIYDNIGMSKSHFYKIKDKSFVPRDFESEIRKLSLENFDLHVNLNLKEAELIEERNRKSMVNFNELNNARKQVEYMMNLNKKLEIENKRLRESVKIEKQGIISKHLN